MTIPLRPACGRILLLGFFLVPPLPRLLLGQAPEQGFEPESSLSLIEALRKKVDLHEDTSGDLRALASELEALEDGVRASKPERSGGELEEALKLYALIGTAEGLAGELARRDAPQPREALSEALSAVREQARFLAGWARGAASLGPGGSPADKFLASHPELAKPKTGGGSQLKTAGTVVQGLKNPFGFPGEWAEGIPWVSGPKPRPEKESAEPKKETGRGAGSLILVPGTGHGKEPSSSSPADDWMGMMASLWELQKGGIKNLADQTAQAFQETAGMARPNPPPPDEGKGTPQDPEREESIKKAAASLDEMLKTKDFKELDHILFELAHLKAAQHATKIAQLLKEQDAKVRYSAVDPLRDLGVPETFPALAERVQDENEDELVRAGSMRVLGELKALGPEKSYVSRQTLEKALEAKSGIVRAAAFVGLSFYLPKADYAAKALELLQDGDANVRCAAAEALGKLEAKESAPRLLELLTKDPDANVRLAAVKALVRLGIRETFQAMLERLMDEKEDPRVRVEALRELEGRRELRLENMEKLTRDKSAEVRREALFGLNYYLPKGEYAEKVAKVLEQEKEEKVQEAAISILGNLKAKAYAPLVAKHATQSGHFVRWIAYDALSRMGAASEQAGEIAKVLGEAEDEGVLTDALKFFESLRDKNYKEKAAAVLERFKPRSEDKANEANRRFSIRLAAVNALDAMGAYEIDPEESKKLRAGKGQALVKAALNLLSLQRQDGRWEGEGVGQGGTLDAQLAVTSLAVEALSKALSDPKRARGWGFSEEDLKKTSAAIESGSRFIEANSSCAQGDSWCGLRPFRLAYVFPRLAQMEKDKSKKPIEETLRQIEISHKEDGGFGYANETKSATFTTAVVILGLIEGAEKGGSDLGRSQQTLKRAALNLEASRTGGLFPYRLGEPEWRPAGAASRTVVCEYAVYKYHQFIKDGKADKARLEKALELYMRNRKTLENVARAQQANPHSAPDQISDYYYLFSMRYASLALGETDFPGKKGYSEELEISLLKSQSAPGTWKDSRFGEGYGTAMALLSLLDLPAGQ